MMSGTVYLPYFKFAMEKPDFFKKNLQELFEVDALHQRMYERSPSFFDVYKDENFSR